MGKFRRHRNPLPVPQPGWKMTRLLKTSFCI
jgi:hypothetical protein